MESKIKREKGFYMDQMIGEYSLQTFMPLITIFSIVVAITVAHQWYYGFNVHDAMRIFMASFF